jgi:hypothetical protein
MKEANLKIWPVNKMQMQNVSWFKSFSRSDVFVPVAFALLKLSIHLLANGGYGFFRDELYYIACGEHLDFGYVDHPPFVALVTKMSRLLLGDSLFSLRLLPAIAGACIVFLTGLVIRELGGKTFAQTLGCVAVIISPVYLNIGNHMSMNVFDHLFWTLSALLMIRILKTENTKLWLALGVVLGIGLQNKHSVFFFGFGLLAGLVLTSARKHLFTLELWLGVTVAFVVFLPNLIWQFVHGFPSLEFIRNASLYKNISLSPQEFLAGQIMEMHIFLFPILLLGLFYYLFLKSAKPFRVFGWMYIAIFGLFILTSAKTYYIAPIYPLMFAGGAVAFETLIGRCSIRWLKPAALAFLCGGGLMTAPLALPVLPVKTFIKYTEFLGLSAHRTENHEMGQLPQHFADMFGWEELTRSVNDVYQTLSPQDRAKCGIYAQNYGEAGAIDFFGRSYGLPEVIAGHNNYYLWGPRHFSGEVMIIIGGERADHEDVFESVEQAALFQHDYVMPYENNLPLFICRGVKAPLEELWPRVKHYD